MFNQIYFLSPCLFPSMVPALTDAFTSSEYSG